MPFSLDTLNKLRDDLGDPDGRFWTDTAALARLMEEAEGDYWAALDIGLDRMVARLVSDPRYVSGRDPGESLKKAEILLKYHESIRRRRPLTSIIPDDRTLVQGGIRYRTTSEDAF